MMPLRWRLIRTVLRLRSWLKIGARQLTVILRIRRWTIVLRTRLAWFLPALLPVLLPRSLHIRARYVALLIVSILTK